MNTKKWCNSSKDVPNGDHYAIIEFSSYYVEGDERSRTNPGHGYPGHTETTQRYITFTDRAEWEADIAQRMERKYSQNDFVAIKSTKAVIQTEFKVKID